MPNMENMDSTPPTEFKKTLEGLNCKRHGNLQ